MAIADMTEYEQKVLKKLDALIGLQASTLGVLIDQQVDAGNMPRAKANEMAQYIEILMVGGMEKEGVWEEVNKKE